MSRGAGRCGAGIEPGPFSRLSGHTIEANLRRIGHVQLGNNPGHHEPGNGEMDCRLLLDFIDGLGYQGWTGCIHLCFSHGYTLADNRPGELSGDRDPGYVLCC